MKRVSNPPNPYLSAHHEWLEAPPPALPEVYVEQARSILSENDSPDLHFRWTANPYRGCQHACAYCYARPTHEYLGFGAGSDFETRLIVKENAPELLRKAFSSRKWRGELVAFSGVTDCYQPLEAAWQLTRRCLEVCLEFGNPTCVVTKSYLVRRDADLLARLSAEAAGHVCVSIPFADAKHCRLIEPQAPVPERRFEALRVLADAGVPVGVLVAPIIPGLSDSEIPRVLARAAECGARTAWFMPLRLSGNVEPVFFKRLREVLPLRAERIEHRLREIRGGGLNDCRFHDRMTGQGNYWEAIERLFKVSCQRYGLKRPPCMTQAAGRGGCHDACGGTTAKQVPNTRLRKGEQLELPFA